MDIGKFWRVESNDLNVILKRRMRSKNRETGEMYDAWPNVAYYGTVEQALHSFVDRGVKETGLTDLKTIVAKLDEIHKDIKELKV